MIVGILWGLAAAIVLTFLYTEFGFSDALSKFYLMPWCLATAAVIVAPSVYMVYKGTFDPFHPLVFPAWSYFFPGFVIGGFVLASGISQPYFLSFIQDEHTNLPLTFVYVMLGYAGLTVGFVLPFGKKVGEAIRSWLPSWEWRTEQIAIPALLLFILGLANTILAFALGIIGFQRMEEIGAFDGLIFLFSLFWIEGCVLLWLYIFKSEKLTPTHYFILAVVLSVSFARVAFQGNRSGFIQMLVTIGFAFFVSQKKVTLKHSMIGGILVVLALFVGMIYGTAFRAVKGSHDRASLTQIADTISSTGERLSSNDIGSNLGNGLAAIGERIDSISSLAVVVSNYEALAPYEESYGMDNNIMNELTTFLIPRMIWKDKPISIEPSKYADLYFNFPDNSFAMTPMGDL
ncbi:MAG TPA: hypothetical protein VJL58_12325, partial [Pyrinomonadaceae bacterium]|nr:hypothetical protein [Pyrinomonadaceae bacterium]